MLKDNAPVARYTDGVPFIYSQERAELMAKLLAEGWWLVAENIDNDKSTDWRSRVHSAINQTPHELG